MQERKKEKEKETKIIKQTEKDTEKKDRPERQTKTLGQRDSRRDKETQTKRDLYRARQTKRRTDRESDELIDRQVPEGTTMRLTFCHIVLSEREIV